MRQHSVQSQLRTRVLRFLEYKHSTQKELVQEDRLTVLSLLSDNLHAELQYAVSFAGLLVHPLFGYAESVSKQTMHGLVESVLSTTSCAAQDVLFFRGILNTHMYVVVSGKLTYQLPGTRDQSVRPGDWLCEATLWATWISRGDLHVAKECGLILVEAKNFASEVLKDQMMWALMASYAEVYVEWLNTVEFADLTDVCSGTHARDAATGFLAQSKKNRANDAKCALMDSD